MDIFIIPKVSLYLLFKKTGLQRKDRIWFYDGSELIVSKYNFKIFSNVFLIFSIWILMSCMVTPAKAESNYTAILEIGQTPLQIGPFFGNGLTGWSWWGGDDIAGKQKNIITLMLLN